MVDPTVFISYSWTSDEYCDRVRDLADQLIANKIQVILDQYDLKVGADRFHFMEQMVSSPNVHRVLMLCDARYKERADGRGGGVGVETTIVSDELYKKIQEQQNDKFIPIAMDVNPEGGFNLPVMLRSTFSFDFSTPEMQAQNLEGLIRHIYDKPLRKKPALGTTPSYILEPDRPSSVTLGLSARIRGALERGQEKVAEGLADDYFEKLAHVISAQPVPSGYDFDEAVYVALESFLDTYIREFGETITCMLKYSVNGSALVGRLAKLLEAGANAVERTIESAGEHFGDHISGATRELLVHAVAVFLQREAFDLVDGLLSRKFFVQAQHRSPRYINFADLDFYPRSLDERRIARLKLDRASVYADIIHSRAGGQVSWDAYCGADVFLRLRATAVGMRWYPRSLPFWNRRTPQIFLRAAEQSYFRRLSPLLGVTSKEEYLALAARSQISPHRQYEMFAASMVEMTHARSVDSI